ncbi:MAG: CpsD/CapB family tyrosine-protein kinase [Acidobacteriota bacterium]
MVDRCKDDLPNSSIVSRGVRSGGHVRKVDFTSPQRGGKPEVNPGGSRCVSWRAMSHEDHLPALTDAFSPLTEQFRLLRVRLEGVATSSGGPPRVVAVTSALPGEGKTCTALNTAIVAARELNRRVVLVECDLRRPRLAGLLANSPPCGLTRVLENGRPLAGALLKIGRPEGLSLLLAGGMPDNPAELLGSAAMAAVVERLRKQFDLVLLDTPPALCFADSSRLGPLADGFLLVVRAGKTPREALLKTSRLLDPYGVLGVVVNGVPVGSRKAYGYSYGYHTYGHHGAERSENQ